MNVLSAEANASAGDGQLVGVIVSLGGQTPLKLSHALGEHTVLGTSPESIDLAEDRERWNDLCERLGIPQPAGGTATTVDEALAVASKVGYPVLVRPSYVLGGRAMEIVYDDERLSEVVHELGGSFGSLEREGGVSAKRPLLVDRFLEDAVEVDVDAVRDATGEVLIAGVMEHVEEAGVHSGDSACAPSPQTLGVDVLETIGIHTRAIAEALDGDRTRQRAVRRQRRRLVRARGESESAAATVPFVAKATGVPVAMVAARVMLGSSLAALRSEGLLTEPSSRWTRERQGGGASVRPLPRDRHASRARDAFHRRGDGKSARPSASRSPRARSRPARAYRTREPCSCPWPTGTRPGLELARTFRELGFEIAATSGTAAYLASRDIPVATVAAKVGESGSPNAASLIVAGAVHWS